MMLPKARGEAGTHRVSLLALLCTVFLTYLVSGCRPAATPALARHSVRLQALIPLHPSWGQVVALDRELARIHNGAAPGDSAAFQVAPPALLTADTLPPQLLAQQRERLAQDDLRRYLDQLGTALQLREESVLNRIIEPPRPAGPSAEDLRHQAEIAKLAQELRDRALLEAAPLEREIDALRFRQIVLQTQMDAATNLFPNSLRNQPLFDAQVQMALVNRQIEVKMTQVEGLKRTDFLGLAELKLRPMGGSGRPQEETPQERLSKRRTEQRAKLDREREQELAKARTDLESLPAPLPELSGGPPPPPDPRATSLSPFRAPDVPAAFAKAQAQVNAARERDRALHEAEKARLLAQIQDDTEDAVVQIARQQGWTLVPEGQSNEDWTDQVIKDLRAQWMPGSIR